MLVALLGYVGYGLINLWSPLQILHMIRGHHIQLGRLPLVTLAVGLICLQVSFGLDALPLYTQIGNASSLIFTVSMLGLVTYRRQRGR